MLRCKSSLANRRRLRPGPWLCAMLALSAPALAQPPAPPARPAAVPAAAPTPPPSGDSAALVREADQLVVEGKLTQARASFEAAIKAGARIDQDFGRARTLAICYLNGAPSDLKKAAQWFEVAYKLNSKEDVRLALAQ